MDTATLIRSELENLGYQTKIVESTQGTTIAFRYTLELGSRKGETVWVGVNPQDGQFPEFPPHWLHVSPPINDQRGSSCTAYEDNEGNE